MREIRQIVLHHSASTFGTALMIDSWHRDRGWDGIGYHYVVRNGYETARSIYDVAMDGWIEEGRDVAVSGAHVRGHNAHSIGICLIGEETFTEIQFLRTMLFVQSLLDEYGLPIKAVVGHGELAPTECPAFNMALFRAALMMRLHPCGDVWIPDRKEIAMSTLNPRGLRRPRDGRGGGKGVAGGRRGGRNTGGCANGGAGGGSGGGAGGGKGRTG
jgi:hypothetical protein